MNLAKIERLTLANQFKILAALYPDEASYYNKYRKVIEEGYTLHYEDFFQHIYDELPDSACSEALNILDMHSALFISWQRLQDKAGIKESEVRFPGFDGNNEAQYLSYCEFFLNDLDRFNELQREDYNSHMPTLRAYRSMLERWVALKRSGELLTVEQIRTILDAPHKQRNG